MYILCLYKGLSCKHVRIYSHYVPACVSVVINGNISKRDYKNTVYNKNILYFKGIVNVLI